MGTGIVAQNLIITKGSKQILKSISCSVQPGVLTGLIGPSGSGKTTLMRSIIGAQKITDGMLTVRSLPAGSKKLRSQIGYVTQAPAIYDDLTVYQNIAYFAAIMGAGKAQITNVLKKVGLDTQHGQIASTLSGGERARVSLAIALVGNAPVLVFDEPTVGLDPLLRRDLWNLFAELASEGRTVLVSSHVMDEAERCTDLLLLRQGTVLFEGSKQALLKVTGSSTVEAAFVSLIEKRE